MKFLRLFTILIFVWLLIIFVARSASAADRTAPTVPTGLTATPASTTQIDLTWTASTDSSGIKDYGVFADGKLKAVVTATSYSHTGLTAGSTHSYQVSARDTAGNISGRSTTVMATTSTSGGGGGGPVTIGYLGCSMTMAAVNGALNLGMADIWSTKPEYGGGGVWEWAQNFNNKYWGAFQTALNTQPVTTFWWELCSISSDFSRQTLANAINVINEVQRRVPGARIFVSAQPAYNPSSHECQIAGIGGQAMMADLADQLVAGGYAEAGPVQGPLAYPSQVKTDGCHPVSSGEAVLGQQLIAFPFN